MRSNHLAVLVLASACSDPSPATQRLDGGFIVGDSGEFAPQITSFKASPSQLTAGVATPVTWTWTYLVEPTFPNPTCAIDNGVGTVTNGQMTMVTLTQVTLFTLTCTNSQGSTSRQLVVGVPPVAPQLSTFTVSPTSSALNASQSYTFTWSYTNTPSPTPTCYVDGAGTSPITSGTSMSLTLPQARTFRLRCSNTGSATAVSLDATVAVTECGTAAAQCNPNANCTDTLNGYTCACASGFSASSSDPNVCNYVTASSGNCDLTNGTFTGTACQCNAGFIGSGATGDCTRARIAFTTSTTGTGATGTWSGATGTGLAAADSVCAARATAASLPGTYKAWMSDQNDDAYCRIAGYSGKKSAMCGQGSLPTLAGPWVRTGDRKQFAPILSKLVAPTRQHYYPAMYNESGSTISNSGGSPARIWTGTDDAGAAVTNTCGDWTNGTVGARGNTGLTYGGASTWTKENGTSLDPTCNSTAALLCMEVGTGGTQGPALNPRSMTTGHKSFLSSVSGNGAVAGWPDAHGVTGTYGYQAADEVCKSRARYAGYANANNYKAWLTTYPYGITSRLNYFSGAYVRPDGVVLGTSYSDLTDRQWGAAWDMTEVNAYEVGTVDTGLAWTGMSYSGSYYSSSYSCGPSYTQGWTSGTNSYQNVLGRFGITDERGYFGVYSSSPYLATCDTVARLYCFED